MTRVTFKIAPWRHSRQIGRSELERYYATWLGAYMITGRSPPILDTVPACAHCPSSLVLLQPKTPHTVSDRAALTIVVANYWSFSISLRSDVVHYRPLIWFHHASSQGIKTKSLSELLTTFVLDLGWWSTDSGFWLRSFSDCVHRWRHFGESFLQIAQI